MNTGLRTKLFHMHPEKVFPVLEGPGVRELLLL